MIRYHVINMEHSLDIEVGWPVSTPVTGAGRVSASVLPAGRYATLIHIGPYDQLRDSNAALIDWIHSSGLAIEQWPDPKGDAFRARYEAYLTNPDEQPDPSKWETEIAIKLAD